MTKADRLPSANVTLCLALGPYGAPEDMVSQSSAAVNNYRSLNPPRSMCFENPSSHGIDKWALSCLRKHLLCIFLKSIPYITLEPNEKHNKNAPLSRENICVFLWNKMCPFCLSTQTKPDLLKTYLFILWQTLWPRTPASSISLTQIENAAVAQNIYFYFTCATLILVMAYNHSQTFAGRTLYFVLQLPWDFLLTLI